MLSEGIVRLVGSNADEFSDAILKHRLVHCHITEPERQGWPDPTAPSLRDFLEEFPKTACAVRVMPYGECSASPEEAEEALSLGGHVQMAMTCVPEVNAWISAFGDELCGGLSHYIRATLTVSSLGAGVAWHHDSDSSLLILQLAGEKTWWISESGDDLHPGRLGHTDARLAAVGGNAQQRAAIAERLDARAKSIVAQPGTVMVVPPYAWHRTRADSTGESWTLLFVIQRGAYHEVEWKRMIAQQWPRELWPELEEFNVQSVATSIEARVREYCEAELVAKKPAILAPRTMLRLVMPIYLSRARGGYWTLHSEVDGQDHEQLISQAFVPILRWVATTHTPFSGYLARAHAPSLSSHRVDRMLMTLLNNGVLELYRSAG